MVCSPNQCAYLAPTLTLSLTRLKWDSSSIRCVQNNFWAYGMFGANCAPILRQDWHYLQTVQNEFPLEPRHLRVPSGVSKMISEPMVLWQKSCTYLAPTLTLSPNRPKWDSTLPTSPRSSIRCDQNDFWGYGMFGANCAPILRQDWHYLQTVQNEFPLEPRHLGVPSGVSKMISEPMVLWRKSCTYLAPTLTLSPNRSKWDSTLPTSPRSSSGCDQNDFWGYGMFGANHAPIVRQD
jgi:hypothetical protein